ncbi:hypothetical protein E5288_WYG008695 [Bos mutus]|uniref:Uncharacterized protein n=1 Tax=Bos mutus TaxID=72004 RepID=A0A6B0RX16_9CETA|nr:hypothetical protein [Bos mutus]
MRNSPTLSGSLEPDSAEEVGKGTPLFPAIFLPNGHGGETKSFRRRWKHPAVQEYISRMCPHTKEQNRAHLSNFSF